MKRAFEETTTNNFAIPVTMYGRKINLTPYPGQRVSTMKADLIVGGKEQFSDVTKTPLSVNDFDAIVLPHTAQSAADITEVVVTKRTSPSSHSEPFRCEGCEDLSAQIKSLTAEMKEQKNTNSLLIAHMEQQNIFKKIDKILVSFVDVDGCFSNLLSSQSNREVLQSIRVDRNACAHYIRSNDSPALKRFKLDIFKRQVQACANNTVLYEEIVETYGETEIKNLFCSLLSPESDRLVGDIAGDSDTGASVGVTELEKSRAEKWWTK